MDLTKNARIRAGSGQSSRSEIIAERTFRLADQRNFATVSGDRNPVHIDAAAARRTIFGAPVVHGVHLLLWAMEALFRSTPRTACALTSLTADFTRGLLLGQPVQVAADVSNGSFVLRVRQGNGENALIHGSLGPSIGYAWTLPLPTRSICRELDYQAASKAQGTLPLCYRAAETAELFPSLAASLPPVQLAALLATTRLVGMVCPGLHSLYSGLDIHFDADPRGAPTMTFQVDHADPRVSFLKLAVTGPGFSGWLRTFLRPTPCRQSTVQELAAMVRPGEFCSQRAVIIGGSRGLGEVVAKLLALGGARVLITYHRGEKEADAVAAEIGAAGGHCDVAYFDATDPRPLTALASPTHLYYFATPQITSEKGINFSVNLFTQYCRYYVSGFAETIRCLIAEETKVQVLYPSTVFLQEPTQMQEYCAAKAAGEELCRQMAARFRHWKIRVVRLPRMLTDQNNGLVRVRSEAPGKIMLEQLRIMNSAAPC